MLQAKQFKTNKNLIPVKQELRSGLHAYLGSPRTEQLLKVKTLEAITDRIPPEYGRSPTAFDFLRELTNWDATKVFCVRTLRISDVTTNASCDAL